MLTWSACAACALLGTIEFLRRNIRAAGIQMQYFANGDGPAGKVLPDLILQLAARNGACRTFSSVHALHHAKPRYN
jgi:hypothetical protein